MQIIRRLLSMISRSKVNLVDDSTPIQNLQLSLLKGETKSKIERIQNYGFTSVPLEGADAICVSIGGNRDNSIVIAVDDKRYRLKTLKDGEVAIYTDEGDYIHFQRENKIEIKTKELTVNSEVKTIINTKEALVETEQATINATAKVDLTTPELKINSLTKIECTTPLMAVSGLIQCSGIAAGGAAPTQGKVTITGDIEASGEIKDNKGTMSQIRTSYNGHKHVQTDPQPTPQM
ncbi:phage baseplate assembly protein V [Halobacteriovorax sp. GB3]|uniref:phage baseplate assembly protein V n=1 Tax=Halobacteriovorax sp. GB3 TaxID=2719615 RepID=UPI00235F8E4B|nr:phage baseplate assembly protein V [Halobacteriovorax sp. GB3]MDD0853000.1 phage baseplate assembly protein V [Halobacteriovorax sp. GB3]